MTIRKTLLLAFLLFSTLSAALMTALAYTSARAALSAEIRLNLESQAADVTHQVETMLFERIKDMQEWQRLELMQEVRVGDIDKRLAQLLHDIKAAYGGVYTDIDCVQKARVVSSSDAARIGRELPEPAQWTQVVLPGGTVSLSRPTPREERPRMTLSTAITDAYDGSLLARLDVHFDWREIAGALTRATARSGREAVLLDATGALLAASPGALARLPRAGPVLPGWQAAKTPHGVVRLKSPVLGTADFLVGYARTSGYRGLPDLGWTVLILTPEKLALAEVDALLARLLLLLLVMVILAALLATRISARTARPLASLTAYAREVTADIDAPPRDIQGGQEVAELSRAFNRLLVQVRDSRAHLVQASKLAAAGEMAARLAHEVRTPLGIIRSSAQLIDRQTGLDARGHEMMHFMINEVDRINALVTGLLESARPRASDFQRHDLATLVQRVLDMLDGRLAEARVTLEWRANATATELDCDSGQLTQLVQNLVLNAAQVLQPGGQVRVTLEDRGASLALCVEDDGPGIPVEQRAAVFEPFVSHRAGGIGLGLPVVREIVRLHQGEIEVDESPLGGARFTVLLPRSRH